jgi:hypothetical protein
MALGHSPSIVTNGLVLCLDAANRKGISPAGCTEFINAPQLVKNLCSPSDVINSFGGVKLGNLNYFTIFSIDYPEGSYGGDAAARDGITPGYNVRSGNKSFDFGRALNYAVWNKDTQTFVKTSVYDSYVGTAAVDTFVAEYAVAKQTWPNAVHIVAGSHRDSYHTTAQYNILRDLGAPNNVDSIINFSSPEWILVGEPGLGAGNGLWAFQNYSTNPDQVAHLNVGLPLFGNTGNYLEFDGTNDYITLPVATTSGQALTISGWLYSTETTATYRNFVDSVSQNPMIWWNTSGQIEFDTEGSYTTPAVYRNQWVYVALSKPAGSSAASYYVNGILVGTGTAYTTPTATPTWFNRATSQTWKGNCSQVSIYNRALSAAEVAQNFNALRGRYSI